VFGQKFTLEDAIGPHASSLEASRHETKGIPLGCQRFLQVRTVNCVQTLKANGQNASPGTPVMLCGECEGDCDNDADCKDGLKCFYRRRSEQSVPGCQSRFMGTTTHNYCYNPTAFPGAMLASCRTANPKWTINSWTLKTLSMHPQLELLHRRYRASTMVDDVEVAELLVGLSLLQVCDSIPSAHSAGCGRVHG
jgi:hypothetical protein